MAVAVSFMPAAQTVLMVPAALAAKEVLIMLWADTVTAAARLNKIAGKFEWRRRPVGLLAAWLKETY